MLMYIYITASAKSQNSMKYNIGIYVIVLSLAPSSLHVKKIANYNIFCKNFQQQYINMEGVFCVKSTCTRMKRFIT